MIKEQKPWHKKDWAIGLFVALFIIIAFLFLKSVFVSNSTSQYVCGDGSVKSNPSECPIIESIEKTITETQYQCADGRIVGDVSRCENGKKTDQDVEEVKESNEFVIPPERLFDNNMWIELGDFKYFIGEPETTYEIKQKYGQRLRSENGQSKFVILPFKIENIGKETTSLWDVNINLITKDDIRYKPLTDVITIEGVGKTLFLEQLQPGISQKGIIVYEIPRGATIKMFELTEEFLPKEERKYIDINYRGLA